MSLSKRPAAATLAGILLSTAVIAGGDFYYPPAGRTEVQQRQDRFECHEWAVAQSQFDPVEFAARLVPVNSPPTAHAADASRQAGRSMLGGAATGALIGEAVDNDADKGAIAGGAAGLLRGRMAEQKAAAERAAAQAHQQQQQSLAAQDVRVKQQDYARARSTCFKARGYTVSEG